MSLLNTISLPRSRKGLRLMEILGNKMYLDLADEGISRELMLDGIREELNIADVRRELKKGDVAVDIGANIGYYALFEAQLVGSEGKVYAIEPVPANVELLRKNIEANGYSNMEVYQFAIGDNHGFQPLYLSKHRNRPTFKDVTGTTKQRWLKGQIDVEVVTLDDFLADKLYPDAIRMDVEGYEYQIIRGMKNTLQRRLPLKLFIEFHFHLMERQESVEILETLKSNGFKIEHISSATAIRGRHRHKLLSKIMQSVEPVIDKGPNRIPSGRHLNLSIDDILSNPEILSGRWRAFHICFKRDKLG